MSDLPPTQSAPLALTARERLATSMHRSRLFPGITSADGALAVIQAGAEIGFGPIASLTGIYLVQGKVTFSAALMASAIRRSADYDFALREHTGERCVIEFFRRGHSLGVSAFTMDDARAAGLASKSLWRQYPRNMLFARAMSNGAKWFCPDVFAGQQVYTPEELDAEPGERGLDAEWQPVTPADAAPGAPAAPVTNGSVSDFAARLDTLVAAFGGEAILVANDGRVPETADELTSIQARLDAERIRRLNTGLSGAGAQAQTQAQQAGGE